MTVMNVKDSICGVEFNDDGTIRRLWGKGRAYDFQATHRHAAKKDLTIKTSFWETLGIRNLED